MFGRILTERQWEALERAEQPLYTDEGTHTYTSVTPREDGGLAAMMWRHAEQMVENTQIENADDSYRDPTSEELMTETAERVAHAIAVLAFSIDFVVGPRP